ncbi:class V lanthionine synthetase subunit LxmK [Streptomyces peucetius]|uniref:Class V lanthionine synthetase subunit LxmK n=1 Tax=Streptomyces peucetius TaxID=1950 RepID=A0ABY6I7Z3_STRPE|nr:class V lanthionine synthetase subunit LxmK [Streptomyces peucetius]UYQ63117.1 class V lanthionine synthetase subunit LxmK [Streptomyces peucetius]
MTDGTTDTLNEYSEVQDLLTRTGFGSLAGQANVRKLPGRNHNWIGTTGTGERVFVKRLEGPAEASAARIRQCVTFDRILRSGASAELLSPRLLAADTEARVLVFACVDEARSAAQAVREDRLTSDLAYSLGHTVGLLHNLPVEEIVHDEGASPLLPSEELLEALPISLFETSSAAELQAWSLLQNDVTLGQALRRLLDRERLADRVAAHCDLRLDQFLIADGAVYLTDFEEFQAGDAARDLGGVVGDLLHRALLDAATSDGAAPEPPSHARMLAQLTDGIGSVRPRITAFWNGYRDTRPTGDSHLAERVAAFAGWHLLDRLLAGARTAPRLAALPRAMAGIGRKALLTPGAFLVTLGLTEAPA